MPPSAKVDCFIWLFNDRNYFRVSLKSLYVRVSFEWTEVPSELFLSFWREALISEYKNVVASEGCTNLVDDHLIDVG